MIDRESHVPIYYQIEKYILQLIQNQDLKSGDIIPSERELTELFNVSRMTVRQAVMNLVNEGVLTRLKGKGTFISDQKIEQPLQGLTSFTEDMQARGLSPSSRLLSFRLVPASHSTAQHLNINEHEPVYEIKRIRLADEIPMAIETTFLSANLIKGVTEDIVNRSLYAYIEETLQLTIDYANQVIESAAALDTDADLLHITPGAPVLLIQRLTYLENDTPLELVQSVYRADRYKFVINMHRGRK